jgi:Na+/H+-dicarboxylate symporter
MLTPLFLAIGLPAQGIGILIAVDAIPDVFATVLNTTGHLVAAALVARRCDDRVDQAPLGSNCPAARSDASLTSDF